MDDTIYVDNNGSESTVKMDTPMIIVDDRTLVPIRFMSNAFGYAGRLGRRYGNSCNP